VSQQCVRRESVYSADGQKRAYVHPTPAIACECRVTSQRRADEKKRRQTDGVDVLANDVIKLGYLQVMKAQANARVRARGIYMGADSWLDWRTCAVAD